MKRFAPTEKELERLSEYGLRPGELVGCERRSYESGELLTREKEPLGRLDFVLSGRARVSTLASDGRALVLCYYVSQGLLGDVELMTGRPVADATVAAVTAVETLSLPTERNAAALLESRRFLEFAARQLAFKLTRSSQGYAASALCSKEQRVCGYLLQNARGGVYAGPLTEAAESLGISYRHLSRVVHRLAGQGVLRRDPQGWRVLAPAELARLAGNV